MRMVVPIEQTAVAPEPACASPGQVRRPVSCLAAPRPHLAEDVRDLLDSLQVAFYRADLEGRVVSVSRAGVTMLGYEFEEELLGRHLAELWRFPEQRAFLGEALRQHGEVTDFEAEILRRDGAALHVTATVQLLHGGRGEAIGYQGIFRDVTERKASEAALRLSEEKFSKVFLTTPDCITVTRLADGTFLDVNPGFERITGWSRGEVLGRSAGAIGFWDDPAQREWMVKQVEQHGEVLYRRLTFRRRDGALREGLYSARRVVLGGEPGVVVVLQDVTESRAAEATRRLQERRLLQALEAADLGTWDWFPASVALTFDERSAQMLGCTPAEAEAGGGYTFWRERLHPDDAPRVWHAMRQHLAGRTPNFEVEARLRHRDGSWVWVLSTGRVLEQDEGGNPHRVCGTLLDMSEHRRLEAERDSMEAQLRQAQKLEAIGQVTGGVAHDFNNLLTVQLANLGLLAELGGLPPEAQELLAEIEHSARAAADLTRRLLAFSRRQVLQPRRVDLNEVTVHFTRMLRRIVREDVRLVSQVDEGRRLWLDADVGLLEQVVMNLAVNAQDAMPSGGVLTLATDAIELPEGAPRAHPEARPGAYVRLTVSDTGHGMDEATARKIFEPFFTTKPPGQGTGLGLATVYGIVKQHGGFIEVESACGRGAVFRIYWPSPAAEVAPPSEAPRPGSHPRGRGETVLLVEDAASVRQALRAMLERLGYRVAEAADSDAAEGVWRSERSGGPAPHRSGDAGAERPRAGEATPAAAPGTRGRGVERPPGGPAGRRAPRRRELPAEALRPRGAGGDGAAGARPRRAGARVDPLARTSGAPSQRRRNQPTTLQRGRVAASTSCSISADRKSTT